MKKLLLLIVALIIALLPGPAQTADVKMSAFTSGTTMADTDFMIYLYYTGGQYYNRKITIANAKTVFGGGGGTAVSTITGSGLTADKVYYMAVGGLTLAKGDASTTVPGICIASAATTCQFSGEYQLTASPSWTIGGLVYVSTATAGSLTQTIPSTSGHQVSIVGVATAVDTVLIMPSLVVVQVP